MPLHQTGRVSPALVGLVWLAGAVLLLVIVPRAVPVAPGVASASAAAGYHTGAAYFAAAGWALFGLVACAVLARFGVLAPAGRESAADTRAGRAWLGAGTELGLVFAVFALAYLPWFLARHQPYSEGVSVI